MEIEQSIDLNVWKKQFAQSRDWNKEWNAMSLKELVMEALQSSHAQLSAYTRVSDDIGQLVLRQIESALERVAKVKE